MKRTVDFTELFACAARVGGATIRWRESMRLEVIPEEIAAAARERWEREALERWGRA